jgi:L-ascorbate metabolism protein UlaG (beta-lactamase superfamily)
MPRFSKAKPSEHFDGERFFNPKSSFVHHNFFKGLRMWLSTPKAKWPKHVEHTGIPRLNEKLSPQQAAITFVNHATFLLQLDGLNILTDPVWSKRVSPFTWLGPKRVRKPGIAFDELPNIDLIIISHNHYDHMDLKTLKRLRKFNPKVIVPIGDKALMQAIGLKDVVELDWWEEVEINTSTKIVFAPTKHFSSRSLVDHNCSLWGSYIIQSHGKQIYFGGDAAYSHHYHDIFSKFGSVDLALLGIGAYEPSWFMRESHMSPAEAVQAHLDLHAKLSIGMHFGTFQLSSEAIQQPIYDLKTGLNRLGVAEESFITISEGDTKVLNFTY